MRCKVTQDRSMTGRAACDMMGAMTPFRSRGRSRLWLRAILMPAMLLLAYLLWPLADRRWELAVSHEAKDSRREYLAAEREFTLRGVSRQAHPAPRVVLIVADDLALVDVSHYGAQFDASPVPTPEIDRIGLDGATFLQATATTAICAPSRAAILTGRYQQRFGFELQPHQRYPRNRLEYLAFRYVVNTGSMVPVVPAAIPRSEDVRRQGLPATEVTLADLLQARGYRTAVYGKWHLGYDEEFSPLNRGFDEHYGFYEAFSLYSPAGTPGIVDTPIDDFSDRHMWSTGRSGAAAVVHNDTVVDEDEYLTFRFAELAAEYIAEHADEPFFLYLPFSAPHTPLQAPREYYEPLAHIADPVRRTYAAMVATLDDAVGTVISALEASGILDETILIFTSDNGGTSYLGVTDNGPLAGGKFTNYEGGLAVPLMIRYPPAIPAGSIVSEPVSLLDVFATVDRATAIEDASGTERPTRPESLALDGVDLVRWATGDLSERPHHGLFWRSWYNRAARVGDWKLIVTTDDAPDVPSGSTRHELYHLSTDPYERVDRADQHPDIVDDLLRRLHRWEASVSRPLWPPVMHFRHDIWGRTRWFAI